MVPLHVVRQEFCYLYNCEENTVSQTRLNESSGYNQAGGFR